MRLENLKTILFIFLIAFISNNLKSQNVKRRDFYFKVLAFYTRNNDMAHISYLKGANHYFDSISRVKGFEYQSTNESNRMTFDELSKYDVVMFLDTRPKNSNQREAFQKYMEKGGAWMGFHFSAFALEKSAYENDWSWYHNTFLGSGEYKSNT